MKGCGVGWRSDGVYLAWGGSQERKKWFAAKCTWGPYLTWRQTARDFIHPFSCLCCPHTVALPEAPSRLSWSGQDLPQQILAQQLSSNWVANSSCLAGNRNWAHPPSLGSMAITAVEVLFAWFWLLRSGARFCRCSKQAHLQEITSFLPHCDSIMSVTDENAAIFISLQFILPTRLRDLESSRHCHRAT